MGHDKKVTLGHREGIPNAFGQRSDERDAAFSGKAERADRRFNHRDEKSRIIPPKVVSLASELANDQGVEGLSLLLGWMVSDPVLREQVPGEGSSIRPETTRNRDRLESYGR